MQCIENDLMKGHIKYFSFLELLCHWIIAKNRNKQAKKRTVLFSIKDNNKPSIFLEKRYIIAFSLSQFGNRKWNRKWFYISFCMQNRKTLMLCQKLSQQCESRNKFHPRSLFEKELSKLSFKVHCLTQSFKSFVSSVVGVENSRCLWRRNWRCSLCNSVMEWEQHNWRLSCGTETANENVVKILKCQLAENQDWSPWPDAFSLVVGCDR